MKRAAFKMHLKRGCEDEYKRRHDVLWPEMEEALRAAGVSDYAIYLDESTGTLFAVQKLSPDNTAPKLPELPIVRKWWDYMADIMEVDADNSPVVTELREVFYLE